MQSARNFFLLDGCLDVLASSATKRNQFFIYDLSRLVMDLLPSNSEDALFLEVLKLEGKLIALQRVNGLSTNNYTPSISTEPITGTKLSHAISAISTECPDGSSTTEAMDHGDNDGDAEEDASSVSSEDD
jgi:hypothetical protein